MDTAHHHFCSRFIVKIHGKNLKWYPSNSSNVTWKQLWYACDIAVLVKNEELLLNMLDKLVTIKKKLCIKNKQWENQDNENIKKEEKIFEHYCTT